MKCKDRSIAVKLFLSAIFLMAVVYPFMQMVMNIQISDFRRVFQSSSFLPALWTTLKVAVTSTVLSVGIGLILAFCLQRTNIRYKEFLSVVLILPMLLPSISHGMSLIVLFGTNGVLKNLFHLNGTIYGMKGIVIGSVLYSYPSAFLMLNDVLKYEDSSPYEAASVMGIPKHRQTLAITLPYLKRPLISATFAAFTLAVTDYGIPLMIGGKETTLAVLMYQEVLGQVDFGKGSVIGLVLLIPALAAFVFNTCFRGKTNNSFVTKPLTIEKDSVRDMVAYLVCGLAVIALTLMAGAFCIVAFTTKYPSNLTLTLSNLQKTLRLRGGQYLLNSLLIALFVAVIGVVIAFLTAYMTTRMPSKLSQLLHLFAITSLAIPGIVLGLSYAMTFSGSFIYGTLAILVLANLMHFFASPYLMMHNSLSKMNENLENVGFTLGISRVRMILCVIVPQSKSTLMEMFSYFFVNSMITISAVSFLASVSTKPLSLMINQFEAQMQYECAAVVSLIILMVNVAIKGLFYLINRHISEKQSKKIVMEG